MIETTYDFSQPFDEFARSFMNYKVDGLLYHGGFHCGGIRPHVHTKTMGWPAKTVSVLLYLTNGLPLVVRSREIPIFPGKVIVLRADERHGVLKGDGQDRAIIICSGYPAS